MEEKLDETIDVTLKKLKSFKKKKRISQDQYSTLLFLYESSFDIPSILKLNSYVTNDKESYKNLAIPNVRRFKTQTINQIKERRFETSNIDELNRSIYFGDSTFFSVQYQCRQVPIYLKQNGLFSEGDYEYIYENDRFIRITQENFGEISTWQILSITHHQLDWSILWVLNRIGGKVSLWNSKTILAKFPYLKNTEKLYNCILVGYTSVKPIYPVFLKPDGWFSDGTHDYWPTYHILQDTPKSYEFEWYQVVGDKFKSLVGQGKIGKYRSKPGVTLDDLKISEAQQNSLKQHYIDYRTILDLNVNGKFTSERLQKPKWRVNQLNYSQRETLIDSILVGIFIGNINSKKKWVFLKKDGWFSDGKEDYWPNYELYATKNGGQYYTFYPFNVITNMVEPSLYFLYNTNFNHPIIGTATVLSTIGGAYLDLSSFYNYFNNLGIDTSQAFQNTLMIGLTLATADKVYVASHLLHQGNTTKKSQKSHGGRKYNSLKKYKNKRILI